MGQVDISINGRSYEIACDDGQEDHVRRLGEYIDRRVRELVSSVGQVGDARLLVMSSLMVADELSEAYAALEQRQAGGDAEAATVDTDEGAEDTEELADAVEALAARVEGIAESLENA